MCKKKQRKYLKRVKKSTHLICYTVRHILCVIFKNLKSSSVFVYWPVFSQLNYTRGGK